MVKFTENGHKYESTGTDNINWTSVTKLIHNFSQPFDSDTIALKSSKKKSSKWYGMSVSEIQREWKSTNDYSLKLGTWYHKLMEDSILSHSSITVDGKEIPIIKPIVEGDEKIAPDQKLTDGKYPEHFVYLKSVGLCGQADDVEVVNGKVNVNDYKTNKEIKLQSYKNWDGVYQMMSPPLQHVQDCNYMHYCLQLSMYLFIILKHNPLLKPGRITLKHVLFEEQTRDKFDNPVYRLDGDGNFIIKDIQEYKLPYMKSECMILTNWLKIKN